MSGRTNSRSAVGSEDSVRTYRSIRQGAWMLAGVLGAAFLFNIAIIVLTMLVRESGPQISQLVRVFLELAIFVFVMVGHAWARWLTVAGFGLSVLIAVTTISTSLATVPSNVLGALMMAIVGVFHFVVVLSLVLPGPITRYLASRRS